MARKGKKMPKSKEQHLAELPKKEIQNYEPCMGRNYDFRSLSFSRCNKYTH